MDDVINLEKDIESTITIDASLGHSLHSYSNGKKRSAKLLKADLLLTNLHETRLEGK